MDTASEAPVITPRLAPARESTHLGNPPKPSLELGIAILRMDQRGHRSARFNLIRFGWFLVLCNRQPLCCRTWPATICSPGRTLRGQCRAISDAKMPTCLMQLGRDRKIIVGPARHRTGAGHIEIVSP
jgi:hypothetical protein